MNFFKLYIGDYQRDTAHLSVTEHGAYLLMLQHFYATEKPLPIGKALHRMLRAETKQERDAIDNIARMFWTPVDGGISNERAAAELQKADHQRTVNKAVGILGGRPKRTETITDSVSDRIPKETEREPNHNPNQTPDTRHQKKQRAERGTRLPAAWTLPAEWEAWAKAERPDLDPQAVAAKFADHWRSKPGSAAVKLDWLATWRNWVREERSPPVGMNGNGHSPARDEWWKSDVGTDRKAREMGMSARGGETYASLRERMFERLREPAHA